MEDYGDSEEDAEFTIAMIPDPRSTDNKAVLSIQALSREVIIKKIEFNGGLCELTNETKYSFMSPYDLRYGQTFFAFAKICTVNDVKEVSIVTAKQTYTIPFLNGK